MVDTAAGLEAAYDTATFWDNVATGGVSLGIVIELIALLLFLNKDMQQKEKLALFVGSCCVVLGVAGEWTFGGRAAAAAAKIQQLSDREIASLREQTESLKLQTADAEARASEAAIQVALEKYEAPRTLKPELRTQSVGELELFKGQKYVLSTAPADESTQLVCAIDELLRASGWQRALSQGRIAHLPCGDAGLNAGSGLLLEVRSDRAAPTENAAKALQRVLLRDELMQPTIPTNDQDISDKDTVLIAVGTKP